MTHVLIVEDHEENRELFRMLLEANDYRVTAAADGLEALAAARRDPPDVIVSDVLMPKMDGFALCRAWMQDAALKAIPFIFYSATYVRPDDEEFAMALGAVRYLIKPLAVEVFLRELRAVLEQWAGHAAPAPASPLDENTVRALHESALARKLEDKMAQLEAANRKLQESELRFRSMTEMSSDFYWESDAEHRLTQRSSPDKKPSTVSGFERGLQIGERRWDIPHLSPDTAGWAAHRAALDARQPFREFELTRLGTDGSERFISISGDPVFDASGAFTGYRGVGTDITERKRAESALRTSEVQLNGILESTAEGILAVDSKGKVIRANRRFAEMWRIPKPLLDSGSDQALLDFVLSQLNDPDAFVKKVQKLYASNAEDTDTLTFKDGRIFERQSSPLILDGAILGRVWSFRDITERKAAESKIQRLSQLYAALSQCNEAIVRCASAEELFPKICRAAVQFGGMKMAWIGMIDPDTRMIRFAANFGDRADEYLQGLELSVDANNPLARGTAGTAIRQNQPVWCQDYQNDPLTAPWPERRARFGWGASASLPLHRNGVPAGVLTLYAAEVGAFDEDARRLLVEMATDIGFALDNFAREALRENAEKELRAAEEQYRGLVEQSIAGTYIVQDGKFAYVNPRYAEIFGYGSADDLIGRDFLAMVADKDRDNAAENIRRRIKGEIDTISYEFTALRKDGSTVDIGVHGARATHRGRPAVIGLIQDISEKKRAEEQIQRYLTQLETAFMSTVEVATSLSEMRDPYTAGHERRVGKIAAAIGAELGFDERRIEGLRVTGYLHDIGKITIPAEILSKPGKLSQIEFRLIQGHPQSSHDVLKDVKFPWPVAEVALQHHERMDGSGYPQGLKGDAILIEARIVAVADVIEAMSSHRPYRPGLGIEVALEEIERGLGSAYDAEVAAACLHLFREKGYQLPA